MLTRFLGSVLALCVAASSLAGPITIVHVTNAVSRDGTPQPNSAGCSQWRAGMYYGQTTPHSVPTIWWDGLPCTLYTESYTYNNGSGNRTGYRYLWERHDGTRFRTREFQWGFYRPDGQPHASDYFEHFGSPGAQMSQYCDDGCGHTIASGLFSGCRGELFGVYPRDTSDPYLRVFKRDATGRNVIFLIGAEEDIYAWPWGDFNASGSTSVQDVYDFLTCYFSGDNMADWNLDGQFTITDVTSYLEDYFRS